ncbi:MAG TPA: tetratricopeptide repeat protein [Firmicutes bacterium]|nr:tetratricopeptide repeat protein [Bacillota bacterium]HHT42028.1 tetratricopeptide repeat protein [Bacillota bacterium]
MKKRTMLVLVLIVMVSSAVWVQANATSDSLANGFQALYYYAVRLDETFPQVNPLGIAIEEFVKAARYKDQADEANLMMGFIYYHLERPGTALGYFLEFAQAHPEEAWVQAIIGDLYAEMGRLAEAQQSYERAAASGSEEESFARAYYGLGNIALERGRYEEAKEAFAKALEDAGDFFDARLGLGQAHYHLGEYEEAIEELELAQLYAPRSVSVLQYLGMSYEAAGRTEQAEHAYSRIEELGNTN